MWKSLLLAPLLLCSCQEITSPVFLVTFPAVNPADSEASLCVSILHPNETLHVSVLLKHQSESTNLLEERTAVPLYKCFSYHTPAVQEDSVQMIRVEVRGQSFELVKESKIMFRPVRPVTFIQTDKPVYKPGQTVNFRIVSIDTKFVPVSLLYSMVEIEDPSDNKIAQWTNVSSDDKILQLSHPLNAEVAQGLYSINVYSGSQRIDQNTFKVLEYVLPKFEVKVNQPSKVNVLDPEIKAEVCATYTYGQPVPGKAQLQLCRNKSPYILLSTVELENLCQTKSLELDKTGCGSYGFNLTYFAELHHSLDRSLTFTVKVVEDGTDVDITETARTEMDFVIGKVFFFDTPSVYKSDTRIEGKIKVVYYNESAVAGSPVYVYKGRWYDKSLLLNLTTDEMGVAHFSLNETSQSEIYLQASIYPPDHVQIHHNIPRFDEARHAISHYQSGEPMPLPASPAVSSLSVKPKEKPLPCGQPEPITIHYTIVEHIAESEPLELYYLVLSRGAIVHHGQLQVTLDVQEAGVREGETSFQLSVDPDLAPLVQILAYMVLPNDNILATSSDISTEMCLKNKVSLQFVPPKAVPGEKAMLEVQAQPGSLCGLTSVDKSVLLLDSQKRLDVNKVFSMLPVQRGGHIPYQVEDPEFCLPVRPKRYVRWPDAQSGVDQIFQGLGLKVVTNLVLGMPSCLLFKGKRFRFMDPIAMHYDAVPLANRFEGSPGSSPVLETIRTFFPETWIWSLVDIGTSGSTEVPLTVPDTITTWETDAFCLSKEGLGVAPPVQFTVFQPFFLELTLPYSIIRGEHFELKATVFNYLPKCIMVTVTAPQSSDYQLESCPGCQYSSCVCASETKTFRWVLVASVLGALNVSVSAEAVPSQTVCDNEVVSVPDRGRIDSVTRTLLVKPEGLEKSESQNWLLCPLGALLREEAELHLPVDLVEGSARASLSVLGDMLGRAMKNLDNLLAMPYGCGEQNMALLAPNIYILHYLKATSQLTPDILERATRFLKSGYQRQLRYRHTNGAFSTFGVGEGNNWLTAFVVKSFANARPFIYIDPKVIKDAIAWISKSQKTDGCFKTVGSLFNNRMKGGVKDDVTLTAYITAALLESGDSHQSLNNSLACLGSDTSYLSNNYATALLAYTFSLAGDMQKRAQLLEHLKRVAIDQGGNVHWTQSSSDTSLSLSVEISSYVLLAVLTPSPVSTVDLGYASKIVSWLVKQQNPYGGFSSTQDTVVALQALSRYSTLVHSTEGTSSVTVTEASGEQHQFTVNHDNRLLYQEKALQHVQGKYSIEVQGTTCVSVQVALRYNIPPPTLMSDLHINTTVLNHCPKDQRGEMLILSFTLSYMGERNSTNMVVVDIKMLSGFVPTPSSVEHLKHLVQRVDVQEDRVFIYLLSVPSHVPLTYHLSLKQEIKVDNLKPAVIKVYDYYQPSDFTVAEYASTCNKETEAQ